MERRDYLRALSVAPLSPMAIPGTADAATEAAETITNIDPSGNPYIGVTQFGIEDGTITRTSALRLDDDNHVERIELTEDSRVETPSTLDGWTFVGTGYTESEPLGDVFRHTGFRAIIMHETGVWSTVKLSEGDSIDESTDGGGDAQ